VSKAVSKVAGDERELHKSYKNINIDKIKVSMMCPLCLINLTLLEGI